MYHFKKLLPVIVVILLQSLLLKVNCQCSETRRAVRNYGQILPVGVPFGVGARESGENSTTFKSAEYDSNENKSTTTTTVAPRVQNFTRIKTDNDDVEEENGRRRESDRVNNSVKDKEKNNNTFVYSAPVIAPSSQYNQKLSTTFSEEEKPILEIRGSSHRQNSSEKYRNKENGDDTVLYNGYIVAPRINITRKAVEGENVRRNIPERVKQENVTFSYSTSESSLRPHANHTSHRGTTNEEIYSRNRENGRLKGGELRQTSSSSNRSNQTRQETSTERTLRRKQNKKQKKVHEDEDK